MGPGGIVEADPLTDDPFGLEAVRQLVQVDRFIFERAPQPLDEDVVHAAAPTVHGDRHIRVLEDTGEVEAGELAALVGVEDLRLAASASDWFWEMDENLRFTYFSDRSDKLGLSANDWIGKTRLDSTADEDTDQPKWRASPCGDVGKPSGLSIISMGLSPRWTSAGVWPSSAE